MTGLYSGTVLCDSTVTHSFKHAHLEHLLVYEKGCVPQIPGGELAHPHKTAEDLPVH